MSKAREPSILEHDFIVLWHMLYGYTREPEQQYVVGWDGRELRFDFAWKQERVFVEVDGDTHGRARYSSSGRRYKSSGSHTTAAGYQRNMAKRNRAVANGWCVLAYTSDDVRKRSAEMLDQIMSVLNLRRHGRPVITPEMAKNMPCPFLGPEPDL